MKYSPSDLRFIANHIPQPEIGEWDFKQILLDVADQIEALTPGSIDVDELDKREP